jgi:hypothetical protein
MTGGAGLAAGEGDRGGRRAHAAAARVRGTLARAGPRRKRERGREARAGETGWGAAHAGKEEKEGCWALGGPCGREEGRERAGLGQGFGLLSLLLLFLFFSILN